MESKPSHTVIVSTVLLLVGLVIGFFIGNFVDGSPAWQFSGANPEKLIKSSDLVDQDIFTSQNATVVGTIKIIDNDTLSITDRSGKQVQFAVSPNLSIIKYSNSPQNPQASRSANLMAIEVDREASVGLVYENGAYVVTQVTYWPKPTVQPASQSGKLKSGPV